MSRIGKKPISVPAGVDVKCENNFVTVKGPKGEASRQFHTDLGIEVADGVINVTRPNDDKEYRSLHGLTRSLIANMVEGVTNGYSKTLIIEGVGYRAAKQGNNVVMNLGYSHQVIVPEIDGIKLEVKIAEGLTVTVNRATVRDVVNDEGENAAPAPKAKKQSKAVEKK